MCSEELSLDARLFEFHQLHRVQINLKIDIKLVQHDEPLVGHDDILGPVVFLQAQAFDRFNILNRLLLPFPAWILHEFVQRHGTEVVKIKPEQALIIFK